MRETLKMMQSILIGKEKDTKELDLIKQYKNELCPNILAYFYIENYGLISNVARFFPYLLDEDKASFCLQVLDKCLLSYKINSNVKFSTYFIKSFSNCLQTKTSEILAQKRKLLFSTEPLFEEIVSVQELNISNINNILDTYNLTDKEKKHCKLLEAGYSLREISKLFKVSESMIYKRNYKIKQKILNSGIDFV